MMTGKKTHRMSVTLDDTEKQLLELIAGHYHTSKCEVVRHALHQTFEAEIKEIQKKKIPKE